MIEFPKETTYAWNFSFFSEKFVNYKSRLFLLEWTMVDCLLKHLSTSLKLLILYVFISYFTSKKLFITSSYYCFNIHRICRVVISHSRHLAMYVLSFIVFSLWILLMSKNKLWISTVFFIAFLFHWYVHWFLFIISFLLLTLVLTYSSFFSFLKWELMSWILRPFFFKAQAF